MPLWALLKISVLPDTLTTFYQVTLGAGLPLVTQVTSIVSPCPQPR